MSVVTIRSGELAIQDPSDIRVYIFDWDQLNLAVGVTIASSSFTITSIRPTGDTALVKDNEGILAGNRKTSLRLSVGTMDTIYEIANKIVTNEVPAQTKERSFQLLIEDQ